MLADVTQKRAKTNIRKHNDGLLVYKLPSDSHNNAKNM